MATAKSKVTTTTASAHVTRLQHQRVTACIVGESGLYFNAMSAKAKRDLLMGGRKKTAAEKASQAKHQPRMEFHSSIYELLEGPTMLGFPAAGIKSAMAAAALVTPGIKKTDLQKLVYVEGDMLPVYGDPYLRMDVVRSADMNRTPDVRTRAFLPRFALRVDICYVAPNLSFDDVASLLQNAGVVAGIGDFRQEKGRGNFGRFRVTDEKDPEFLEILEMGREAQKASMELCKPYDADTRDLLQFFDDEMGRRDMVAA